MSVKRRTIIKSLSGLIGSAFLAGMYTWQVEPFWLEFVHHKLPIKNLPDHLIGKTLMQISDMHVGNQFRISYLIESLQKAQAFEPDIVVYTGDYVSYENKKQYAQLEEVMKHAVQGKLGAVGILGNHDYGFNWAQDEVAYRIQHILSKSGIKILRNDATVISNLNIIGIDDYWATNFYPQDAFKNYNPDIANIVLCHNPDVCDLDVWNNYKGWILSGHTHGGQCKPPFLPPPIIPVKNKNYTSGLFALGDGRSLYINRALGHLMQVRFNVRPEITVFGLEKES